MFAGPAVPGVQGSLATQALATSSVLAYSDLVSAVLLILIGKWIGPRVDEEGERTGLDLSQHRERIGT